MKHSQFNGVVDTHDKTRLFEQLASGIIDAEHLKQLKQALSFVFSAFDPEDSRSSALDISLILKHLGVDAETLIAALLSDPRLRDSLDNYTIDQQFNPSIANLVKHVNWLNTFKECSEHLAYIPAEAESLHRMLLATVDDVRAVLIKLAFRIQRLRTLNNESKMIQQCITQETMDIYAPLANRLGVSNLKWEMEDLAFRYIDTQSYKDLAKSMADKRSDREIYIEQFVHHLENILAQDSITAQMYGRPKHLYSIWKKMQKKNIQWHELADLLAVRIIATDLPQCYLILGIIHNQWQHLPHEFDDYIANPKDNAYQSIHTAIIGPDNQVIEIQIRTQEMHDFAEHGVAAHWRYKEGSNQDIALEKTISTLRRLLDNRIDNDTLLEEFKTELFSDRVLVLTPKKEVINLPSGATALDFAYAIHTEVGHQCIGAIVNGHRVPLSYPIRSGECIEILTDENSSPHLYWLDHRKHYVNTIHSKSRIRQWFKSQFKDDENNLVVSSKHLQGIGNHKVSLANCCEPQVGDRIIGELLADTSIRIHHIDCPLIKVEYNHHNENQKLLELCWGEQSPKEKVNIHIDAFDRQGLLQDITTVLNQEQVNVLKANTETDIIDQSVSMELSFEIDSQTQCEPLLKRILHIPNVFQAFVIS
ncbi:MAG: HD domain-containing protein [gamma proteobacterium symbiont of Bathyaustriella thionipta]|nr:HD domain-containing protein [gamma proteobacterium symbiont of Bathyaustriella thionipta]MCU7949262.1 HD domain-containing protein [gamma proteobacterium symbiont of Bathyaustriella thionipta]MCU7954402.1 HD domain-containing protein [gamma proteobacterium symbiont of Bathyaustriella thionipta]MCU7955877.1 HD domain-containing protein [gamma proteobacterium symbiont of Bathyaustriella thionipta]MCU7966077.1 HD domain-containing protein [gamma proteobacterium symbiont of Bathyaustriella thio